MGPVLNGINFFVTRDPQTLKHRDSTTCATVTEFVTPEFAALRTNANKAKLAVLNACDAQTYQEVNAIRASPSKNSVKRWPPESR